MTALGTFFPERANLHVPSMQYAADVGDDGIGQINIPAIVAASATAVATAVDADGAVAETAVDIEFPAKFGQVASVVASGATGGNLIITLKGRDYLGQKMSETITVTNGDGTTAVPGVKAFKHIDSYEGDGGAANAVTVNIGTGTKLGLPYKAFALISELVSDAVPGNAGAVTAGLATATAATISNADPRGLYAPHSSFVPNGTRDWTLTCSFDDENLHGNAHYYA